MEIKILPIDKICPNQFQPRQSFPRDDIEGFARNIKRVGLLQPITVRAENGTYRIITGERRWRASKVAGLSEIPAIVKDIDDSQLMIESLIEKRHRVDWTPLEKARAIADIYLDFTDYQRARIEFPDLQMRARACLYCKRT